MTPFAKFRRRASHLLHREPWWAEFWAGAGVLVWALWSYMASIGPDERPIFRIVTRLADESFWQFSGLILGLVQIASLLVDHRAARRGSCFLGSWWWTYLLFALWLSDPNAPSLGLYAIMAAINLFSLVRLKREGA